MKIVNAAYEVLKDYSGNIEKTDSTRETEGDSYPQALNEALNAVFGIDGLDIEICGAWVWIDGDTFKHRAVLKDAHFRFASKKKRWYFRPENWRSSSRGQYSMEDIREKHGSIRPNVSRSRIEGGGG